MRWVISCLLAAAVFCSAIQVVYTQHESRKLFVELQELEKKRDQLNEEWGKLQLEQSTWATDDRVEEVARAKLGMHDPDTNSLVLIVR